MKMQSSSIEQIAYDREYPEKVNCIDNCDGACCRAKLFMGSTESEAALVINPVRWKRRPVDTNTTVPRKVWMVQRGPTGARFVNVARKIEIPAGHGLIELDEDCLQLDDDGKCGIYEGRPGQCRDGLEPGSAECLGYRAVYAARLAGELE